MKTKAILLSLGIFILSGCNKKEIPSLAAVKEVTDTYFGVEIGDPYRYMENMDDTIFLDWMKEYAEYTRGILDAIPGREALIEKMVEFDGRRSDRVYNLSISESGRYFYLKMTPEDEAGKLYYRDSYEAPESLLYDPADFAEEEGVDYVISSLTPDEKGEKIAINLDPNGSENSTLIVLEVASGRILDERIDRVFGGAVWLRGGNGFFYGKTNSADVHDPSRFLNTKNYYHRLGDPQSSDKVIFSSEMYPETGMRPEEIPFVIYDPYENDYYLIFYTVERYLKLFRSEAGDFDPEKSFDWKPLIRNEDQIQDFYVKGDDLYLYTAKNAPGFNILKTSKTSPDIDHAEVLVPESSLGMISGFSFTSEALYYYLMINGVEERLFRLAYGQDKAEEIMLPVKAGSINVRTRGHKYDDIWVTITGWSLDGKRYRFNPEDKSFVIEQLSSKAEFPEYTDLVVEDLMVPSHDGVMVPLSVIYMAGTPLNGTAPVLMSGYGAYGISSTPYFSPSSLIWTLHGGILAEAHVRGGGELGDEWRLAGQKTTKPNTWKDLIACAEFLQENKYTSPAKTAIYGGSAGGILIGRAMTERPDLFAAAIPLVGVMNPIRAEESPNGPVNAPEFGTVKDSVECMALMEMDSYLKVEDGVKYPATLVTAGFNDPRVIVWQPAKFAARLQAANRSKNQILFDVDYSSGHGVGDTKTKSFEDLADIMAFAFWQTGTEGFK